VKGIRPNSGLSYGLKYAGEVLKEGIGLSRAEVYAENDGRSPYVHSWSTFSRYMGIAKEFVNDMKEMGINRLDKLEYSHVREWLGTKAEYVTEKTMKVNMCALEKFFEAVGREDLAYSLRNDFQELYSMANPSGRALPFSDPERVIEALKDPAHRVVAELQYLTGSRIGDVKKIEVDPESKSVFIEGSKGGRDREIDFSDRVEKFERVAELKERLDRFIEERGWREIRETYYDDLKQAVKSAGEVYSGAHAFRVTYAVERWEELREQGYTEQEADKILTQELGHNREEMSRYYRR